MTGDDVDTVVVVVPVHDEEEHLAACLESVLTAADAASADVSVWVVLDACTDRSAAIAGRIDVRVRDAQLHNVGRARMLGVDAALAGAGDVPLERIWTAHTDADTVVPAHWIEHQLGLARSGFDLVIGTVQPDHRDLTDVQRAAWGVTHADPADRIGNIHGANLGIRADTLLRAGGFPPVVVHEDVGLVEAARVAGARIAASDRARVRTSGRSTGRTPGGFARYLRDDLLADAARRTGLPV